MCSEIYIDDTNIERSDSTCWCPLAWNPETPELEALQKDAFAEFGRLVWEKLHSNKHPGAQTFIAEVKLQRW